MMRKFLPEELKKLSKPHEFSSNEDNGQVTIIGGSKLFHGAPILALKTASRIVDMVFFASPEPSVGGIAEQLKSKLGSFIWIPWDEVGEYIAKSDAILIGPGLMRYHKKMENGKWKMEKRSILSTAARAFSRGFLRKQLQHQMHAIDVSCSDIEFVRGDVRGETIDKRAGAPLCAEIFFHCLHQARAQAGFAVFRGHDQFEDGATLRRV